MNHPPILPTFLVVEDGDEYLRRFTRFLGASFAFVRAGHFAEVLTCLARPPSCAGLLLDLDFRRTAPAALVDEQGRLVGERAARGPQSSSRTSAQVSSQLSEWRGLSDAQGVLILRALRERGVRLPAWLFADLADDAQVTFLETTLAPLRVVSSAVGLPEVAALLTGAAKAQT